MTDYTSTNMRIMAYMERGVRYTTMGLLAIFLVATVAGCTATPEMISAQRDRCTQVGWQPGTPEHAACVERGTTQQQQLQNAALGAAGGAVAGGIIGNLMY